MLFDSTGFVKGEAARSLGKIGSRKAIEPLIDALLDENNEGKWGAAEALGMIKAETAVVPLILALDDKDDFTRLAAAKALGRIKPKKSYRATDQHALRLEPLCKSRSCRSSHENLYKSGRREDADIT
ncbi:HEAT repeat domain-containing protein [Methanosarcina horonobensis]|uniref:HEAT repeat domain-containing protein n=1 Tax=Methanosarcina horonobensis TaxID=418008 RepID=UPI000B13C40F|nr:HEAT repeat domain-containing protein [Methanosarcina horonobensis]